MSEPGAAQKAEERLLWVDVARAAAILLVVLFHLAYELTFDRGLRPVGSIANTLFFIVSGYLLSSRYSGLVSFDFAWFRKRYVRIAPIYYLTLVAIALLFGTQVYSGNLPYDLLTHFLFLDWLDPSTMYSIISPAWFLVPLAAFYLAFPYLNRLIREFQPLMLLAVTVSFAARASEGTWSSYSPAFYLADFCFGILFASKSRSPWLLAPLLIGFLNPVMALPYLLFFLISLVPNLKIDALRTTCSWLGKHTLELFLFHESVIGVALGRWHVCELGVVASMAALLASLGIVMFASGPLTSYLHPGRKLGAGKS